MNCDWFVTPDNLQSGGYKFEFSAGKTFLK